MTISTVANCLPGSKERPDMLTFAYIKTNGSIHIKTSNCKLNILGYVPFVSTITGLSRALAGLVHTITHLVYAIFDEKEMHLNEACLGFKNICIGLTEAIPVIGNIIILAVDLIRIEKYETKVHGLINNNLMAYKGNAALFIYGEEIAKRPLKDFYKDLDLIKKPSTQDIEKIIRNK